MPDLESFWGVTLVILFYVTLRWAVFTAFEDLALRRRRKRGDCDYFLSVSVCSTGRGQVVWCDKNLNHPGKHSVIIAREIEREFGED